MVMAHMMPQVIHSLDTFLAATLTCFIPNLGVIAIANAIKDMRAMTSLNLANNSIGHRGNMDGIKAISSAVKVLAVILVPF
jgi:hypothetical protein